MKISKFLYPIIISATFFTAQQASGSFKFYNETDNDLKIVVQVKHYKDGEIDLKAHKDKTYNFPKAFIVKPEFQGLRVKVKKGPAKKKWSKFICFKPKQGDTHTDRGAYYEAIINPSGSDSMRVNIQWKKFARDRRHNLSIKPVKCK